MYICTVARMSEEKSRRRKLVEFKAKQLLKLRQIEQKLVEKYPDKKEKIESVVNELMYYVNYLLRRDRVANYIHKILEYSREFPELAELVSEQSRLAKS
jgi:hypothetical protein